MVGVGREGGDGGACVRVRVRAWGVGVWGVSAVCVVQCGDAGVRGGCGCGGVGVWSVVCGACKARVRACVFGRKAWEDI